MSTNQQVSQHGWSRPAKLLTCILFGSALAACGGGSSGDGGGSSIKLPVPLALQLDDDGYSMSLANLGGQVDFKEILRVFREQELAIDYLVNAEIDAENDDDSDPLSCTSGSVTRSGLPGNVKVVYNNCVVDNSAFVAGTVDGFYQSKVESRVFGVAAGDVFYQKTDKYNFTFTDSSAELREFHGQNITRSFRAENGGTSKVEFHMMPMEYRRAGEYFAFANTRITSNLSASQVKISQTQQGKVIGSLLDGYVDLATAAGKPIETDTDILDSCPESGVLTFAGLNAEHNSGAGIARVSYGADTTDQGADKVTV